MALNHSYPKDKFESEVPETFRELYTERDGNYVLTGISGIKTQADVDKLQASLNNEREAHKKTKERLRPLSFNGHSIVEMSDDDLKAAIDALDSYDELKTKADSAGKLNDEQINQIVENRLKGRLAPIEREKAKLANELKAAADKITIFESEKRQRTIHDAVRKAITETKAGEFQPTATEDALMMAERVFEVSEDGSVTVKDQVGFTPGISASEWLIEIADKRPHWFGPSSGGGAKGGKASVNLGDNPWTAAKWNKTAQGQFIQQYGEEKAKQAAAAAGSSLDAFYPPKSK